MGRKKGPAGPLKKNKHYKNMAKNYQFRASRRLLFITGDLTGPRTFNEYGFYLCLSKRGPDLKAAGL